MSDSFSDLSYGLYAAFAEKLARSLLVNKTLEKQAKSETRLQVKRPGGELASLELTPFISRPQPVTAFNYFSHVKSYDELLMAYEKARQALPFENDMDNACDYVNPYAEKFLNKLFVDARAFISEQHAVVIADWVKDMDIYVAVKAIESLLNSHADMALLMLSAKRGWHIHFDHMAIRCGSSSRQDAQRVVSLLCSEHDYVSSQAEGENYYQFPEGWNAYPLYKILQNGQVLRIFIDQSDADHPEQIIQHWNHVYGYTAHHLAMRATQMLDGERVAVSLDDVMQGLRDEGLEIMQATGMYTQGLLEQVFTRPERNEAIPQAILDPMIKIDANLPVKIGNGKLLELVSRREVSAGLAQAFFALYGLEYDPSNPLHSVPAYQYFLPAQAAHVIKTSVQI